MAEVRSGMIDAGISCTRRQAAWRMRRGVVRRRPVGSALSASDRRMRSCTSATNLFGAVMIIVHERIV
jgi:hypothetical protein